MECNILTINGVDYTIEIEWSETRNGFKYIVKTYKNIKTHKRTELLFLDKEELKYA